MSLLDQVQPLGAHGAEPSKLRQLSSHHLPGRISPPPAAPARGLAAMRPSMLSLAGAGHQGSEGHYPEEVEGRGRASSPHHASNSTVGLTSGDHQARGSQVPGRRSSVLGPCQSPMPPPPTDRDSNGGSASLAPSCSEVPDAVNQAASPPGSVHDTGAAEYLDMLRGSNSGTTGKGPGSKLGGG
ncbi:hypothetical protein DUNSADRAFT_10278, partial [Dunaliella salina]